jgi:hypothetical protein
MSHKMKSAINKINSNVGNFAILWFNAKAQTHPEWPLRDKPLLPVDVQRRAR